MPICEPPPDMRPNLIFETVNHEAIATAYEGIRKALEAQLLQSAYLMQESYFEDALKRLATARSLRRGWDTYDSEAPNEYALSKSEVILQFLRRENLAPKRLLPSAEGGVGISFVEGDNRAELEIFNSGEVVAATYTSQSEPVVWEIGTDQSLAVAIARIRVHLAS